MLNLFFEKLFIKKFKNKTKKIIILNFLIILFFFNLNANFVSLNHAFEQIDKLPSSRSCLSYAKPDCLNLGDLTKFINLFLRNSKNITKNFSNSYYVEKIKIKEDSEICFIGDLHGCVDSLEDLLKDAIPNNYLDFNSFKILKEDFYIVFLGDYTDRNCYGFETLCLILKLAIANPDKVLLLRGNHENIDMLVEDNDFKEELYRKFSSLRVNINFAISKISEFYKSLPVALFIGAEHGEQYLMCCHGGIDLIFDLDSFLGIDNSQKFCEVSQYSAINFIWTDFCQRNPGVIRVQSITADFMNNFFKRARNNVQAIFRGHQHEAFGLKMLFMPSIFYAHYLNSPYFPESGIFHWKKVVKNEDQESIEGFRIGDYLPIFTISSASSCPFLIGNQYDCCVFLKINRFINNSRLKVYEKEHIFKNLDQSQIEQFDEAFDTNSITKIKDTKWCPCCTIL
ncbi:metallophosphoesterase [Candidatus Babeliales bacterium]|nr:metallophosphoesterase [Candidatus Babeliales bacterium]MCF7899687.1 metallophosphoesterase [Candidatus Babeliales bacterium]